MTVMSYEVRLFQDYGAATESALSHNLLIYSWSNSFTFGGENGEAVAAEYRCCMTSHESKCCKSACDEREH